MYNEQIKCYCIIYKHKHNINKNLYKSILFTLELNSII